ncbi:uncharacterized protein METZ01_LOCUS332895 [marine metagenome]|uniref:NAD-dependent epimerase/dehydratase domain-containing protein n=1 Tax=marine metagenome TaxID=408172 RepID=A0A382Q719_9ZZZZ
MNKSKRVLVVGGSGFIGSHVADQLSHAGYKVHIFDKVQSRWINEDQDITVGDHLDQSLINSLVSKSDLVYHFASIADIAEANLDPVEAVKQNILATTYLLDSCAKADVKRFIFASSLYIYSNHGGVYKSTKLASESLIEDYQKLKGLEYTILRFGSLYGPRANKFNWVHNAIWQALTEGSIERDGDGQEVRDYIHVLDAAKASVDVLDDKFKNKSVLLTGSPSIQVKDLMLMIKAILGDKISLNFHDDKIKGHYGLTPYAFRPKIAEKYTSHTQIDLGQGLLDTIFEVYKSLDEAGEKIAFDFDVEENSN